MAILSAAEYATAVENSYTDGALEAVEAMVAAVNGAILRAIKPFYPEPATVTSITDAPLSRALFLPVTPVRSITSVYLNFSANGDPTLFTADSLLTQYTDYQLNIDDPVNNWSRCGELRRVDNVWGAARWRYPDRLGDSYEGVRGAVMVSYQAGATAVPEELKLAAILATSMALARRKVPGIPSTSESWNGYSTSYAAQFLMKGILESPDVASILSKYQSVHIG